MAYITHIYRNGRKTNERRLVESYREGKTVKQKFIEHIPANTTTTEVYHKTIYYTFLSDIEKLQGDLSLSPENKDLLLKLLDKNLKSVIQETEKDYTSLLNLQGWQNHLEMLRETSDEIVVFSFDLNHLKLINDQSSHDIGNTYVEATADILKSTFSSKDFPSAIAAHPHGDEFYVAFSKEDLRKKDMTKVFDEINKNIESGAKK